MVWVGNRLAISSGQTFPTGSNNIGEITVEDPTNEQHIFAGTGEANYSGDQGTGGGILESSNGGNLWTLSSGPGNAFIGQSIAKIVVDPISSVAGVSKPGAIVYAAVVPTGYNLPENKDGIYQSLDYGVHWDKMPIGNGSNIVPTDLEYTIVNGQFTLWAGLGNVRAYQGFDNRNNGIWKITGNGLFKTPILTAPTERKCRPHFLGRR